MSSQNKYTLSVLVNNQFGVLNRVTSMFRRRQFNIGALTVSETETNQYSRITVVFEGNENAKKQLVSQLSKLPDVKSVKQVETDKSICRELLLIKMENNSNTRVDILSAASAFEAKTVGYSKHTIMFQMCDESRRIDDFIDLMREYNILEICRTGNVSLEKGSKTIRSTIKL